LADFLRNHILFQDKYIDTQFIDNLQTIADGDSQEVELPEGISYAVLQNTLLAVFNDTVVEVPSAIEGEPATLETDTAQDQLDRFLAEDFPGYVAEYDIQVYSGEDGNQTFRKLDRIVNADGLELAFDPQNDTVALEGVDYYNTAGIKIIETAREQLTRLLHGTGFEATYNEYTIPGTDGRQVYHELSEIKNSDGDKLAFESQNTSIKVNGTEHFNTVGISLITASQSLFEVGAGYIESVKVVDQDTYNSYSESGTPSKIFFDGFDELDLSLNSENANTFLLDNNLFDGIANVEGGTEADQFFVHANAATTLLKGGNGDDQYSVGTGTVENISGELFLLGGEGEDSIVVNSEQLTEDADVVFKKNYLEHTTSQDKLNKISSLLGVGDQDSITSAENQKILQALRDQTLNDIDLISVASFEQFRMAVALSSQEYGPELLELFETAQQIFEGDIQQLIEDAEESYLTGIELNIEEY